MQTAAFGDIPDRRVHQIVVADGQPLLLRGAARGIGWPIVDDPLAYLAAVCGRAPHVRCCVVAQADRGSGWDTGDDGEAGEADVDYEALKDVRYPLSEAIERLRPFDTRVQCAADEADHVRGSDNGSSTSGAEMPYMCELYLREAFAAGRPSFDAFSDNFFHTDSAPAGRLEAMYCGSQGTHSNLHTDDPLGTAVILVLSGCKRLVMMPPTVKDELARRLRCKPNRYSQFDVTFPTATPKALHELVRSLQGTIAEVHAGDAVFCPAGWWHHATNISEGLTFSVHDMYLSGTEGVCSWASCGRPLEQLDVLEEVVPFKLRCAQSVTILTEQDWEHFLQVVGLLRAWPKLVSALPCDKRTVQRLQRLGEMIQLAFRSYSDKVCQQPTAEQQLGKDSNSVV